MGVGSRTTDDASDARRGHEAVTYTVGPETSLRLEPGGADLARWLDEFLRPGVEIGDDRPGDPLVHVVAGSADDRRRDAEPVPCFALDRSVVTHPGYRTADGMVVDDEQYGTRIHLTPGGITVERHDSGPRSRAGVMRVVREVLTARAVAAGARQVHAAALERGGRVVVLAGRKEAGKTTLVARLGALGAGAIAANDRVLLTAAGADAWTARAIGTVVSVRPGTRRMIPALAAPFPAVRSPAHLTVDELAALEWPAAAVEPARVTLSPAQFAHALGAARSAGGTVVRIVLLTIDPDLDGYHTTVLDGTTAADKLTTVEYGSRPHGLPRTVFEEWLGTDASSSAASSDATSAAGPPLPVSTLAVGPQVLTDDACALTLAEELFADV